MEQKRSYDRLKVIMQSYCVNYCNDVAMMLVEELCRILVM